MKKKLLLIILNGKEYGGSEKHVVDIINNIDNTKYDISLIMSKGNQMINYIFKEKIGQIYEIDRNNLLALRNIKKILLKENPNIIHAHAARGIVYARLVCRSLRKKIRSKLICTTHGWVLEYLKFKKCKELLFLLNRDLDSVTLCVSKNSMNELISKGYAKDKLRYIYNGIDVDNYNNGARIKNKVVKIGYVGRFTDQKGINYLMETINQLKESDYTFQIYGKGEKRAYIETYIKDNTIMNVKLNEFVPAKEVKNVLYDLDLLLLPSIDEGFPYILVEAIACGLPCIATDVGGVSEIIDNSVGRLINSKSSDLLTKAIIDVSNANVELLSKNCIKKSHLFSINNMIEQLDSIYMEVINEE